MHLMSFFFKHLIFHSVKKLTKKLFLSSIITIYTMSCWGKVTQSPFLTPYLLCVNRILWLKSNILLAIFQHVQCLFRIYMHQWVSIHSNKCKEVSHQNNVLWKGNVKACITFRAFVSLNQPYSMISWNIIRAWNKQRLGSRLN